MKTHSLPAFLRLRRWERTRAGAGDVLRGFLALVRRAGATGRRALDRIWEGFPTSETHHVPAGVLLAGSVVTLLGALGYLFTIHPTSATFSQQWAFGFTFALFALVQGMAGALLSWAPKARPMLLPIAILIDTPRPRPGGVRPGAFSEPGQAPFFPLPVSAQAPAARSAAVSRVASGS